MPLPIREIILGIFSILNDSLQRTAEIILKGLPLERYPLLAYGLASVFLVAVLTLPIWVVLYWISAKLDSWNAQNRAVALEICDMLKANLFSEEELLLTLSELQRRIRKIGAQHFDKSIVLEAGKAGFQRHKGGVWSADCAHYFSGILALWSNVEPKAERKRQSVWYRIWEPYFLILGAIKSASVWCWRTAVFCVVGVFNSLYRLLKYICWLCWEGIKLIWAVFVAVFRLVALILRVCRLLKLFQLCGRGCTWTWRRLCAGARKLRPSPKAKTLLFKFSLNGEEGEFFQRISLRPPFSFEGLSGTVLAKAETPCEIVRIIDATEGVLLETNADVEALKPDTKLRVEARNSQ